jgi:RNA recognition motif-containing protein
MLAALLLDPAEFLCLRQSCFCTLPVSPPLSNLSKRICAMRLYVGNLSFNTEEPQLEQLFGAHGQVESVHLVRDHATGRSRGFAFVEMANDDAGRAACQALDQKEFEGRRLNVNEARPQERRGGGGGGFGGGGGGRNRGGGGGGGFGRGPKREARW